jgi:hypothetical protein
MKFKLGFRVALLTGMLLLLFSTLKTQPVAACSPAWYEGCVSSCSDIYVHCVAGGGSLESCGNAKFSCDDNCAKKLQACYND